MPTRDQVLHAAAAAGGSGPPDYPAASVRLGIPAGQAYLIATGLSADGSGGLGRADRGRPGVLRTSTQHLVNPPAENPTHHPDVVAWLAQRGRATLHHPDG